MTDLERNKANVTFYELMFNQCQPLEAIARYVGAENIQAGAACWREAHRLANIVRHHQPADDDCSEGSRRRVADSAGERHVASSRPDWVPASVAELSIGELTRAGISYRSLQPPVHVELAIARLKSARADAALERFVEVARGACQAHDSKRAVAAGAT
jgi:hypothetical protein